MSDELRRVWDVLSDAANVLNKTTAFSPHEATEKRRVLKRVKS
jgi:hypothetical protein